MNRLRSFLHLRRKSPQSAQEFVDKLREALGKAQLLTQPAVQEDWGWWLEFSGHSTKIALCIYCAEGEGADIAVTLNLSQPRMWSWKRLKVLDTGAIADEIYDALERALEADASIDVVGWVEEFPF